ncbi:hypothetical protein [Bombella pollinis]|uniref:Phage tail protein n=1 Tax=Bombella pollinis TaxID=2967337 RepID=A0ABT3WSU6_9PROT|nr:hypothetical protein [Bombella pollinis]MCX5619916.1 hypothetical protein [Bombella pollinis]
MSDMEESLTFSAFSTEGWERFQRRIDQFLPTEDMLCRALSSTNVRISRMIRAKAARELTEKLGMPRAAIYHRFKSFQTRTRIREGKFWMGLDGVPFIQLRPVESGRGVKTQDGSYYEEGAFITRRRTGKRLLAVFKRTGKARLPVTVPRVDIYDPCLLWLTQQINHPDFQRDYFRRLEHEIKWRTVGNE